MSVCGLILAVLLVVSLTGCGGGNSSSPSLADITTLMGIGVVSQAKSSGVSSSVAGISPNPNWKQLSAPLVNQSAEAGGKSAAKSTGIDLTGSGVYAYVYLAWSTVGGASSYQVFYGGNKVWDSDAAHPNDPADGPTVAYLDLDDELSGKISTAGSYQFLVRALNSYSSVIAEGTVTVSLGVKLGGYPNASYNGTTHALSWGAISGSNGYRVQLYTDSNNTNRSLDSGTGTLLAMTSYDLSGKGLSGYYYGLVDAWATDSSHNPLEITRGIVGLTY